MPKRKRLSTKKPVRKKRSKGKIAFFILFSAAIITLSFFLGLVDKRLLPAVIKIEEHKIQALLNQAIDKSVKASVSGRSLISSDFFAKAEDSSGKIVSLSVNTLLINEICADLSESVDIILASYGMDTVEVPAGALLGVDWLANFGPVYKVKVMPVGSAHVEYDSSFESAGINQINFNVWLTISTRMQVVNPLQTREITVTRAIPLVNTVFAGEIPAMYFNPDSSNK